MENLEHPVSLNSKKCFQEGSKVKKFFLRFFFIHKKISPRLFKNEGFNSFLLVVRSCNVLERLYYLNEIFVWLFFITKKNNPTITLTTFDIFEQRKISHATE